MEAAFSNANWSSGVFRPVPMALMNASLSVQIFQEQSLFRVVILDSVELLNFFWGKVPLGKSGIGLSVQAFDVDSEPFVRCFGSDSANHQALCVGDIEWPT